VQVQRGSRDPGSRGPIHTAWVPGSAKGKHASQGWALRLGICRRQGSGV
jgi:hypothetical protein